MGEGLCAGDPEERFFYCWRALEVLGHWELSNARKRVKAGGASAGIEYFERVSEPLMNGQYARIDGKRLVEVLLQRRNLKAEPLPVSKLYELRDAIAHGDVAPEQQLEILNATPEIVGLAHSATSSTIDAALGGSND